MIKAVIFDLDGTLIDSEPNYFEADHKLLKEYGIELDLEMKKKYVGMSTQEMLEDLSRKYSFSDSIEVLAAKKNRYYMDIARSKTTVFPEMNKFLHLIKEHGYATALASGSSPEIIEEILSITQLSSLFDVVLSSEEVEKGKPEPDVFLESARRLNIRPEHCLVMEDSQYGVEAAKRASMVCVAIPYPTDGPLPEAFAKADYLVKGGMGNFSAEKTFRWLTQL